MLNPSLFKDIIKSARDGIVVTEKRGDEHPIVFANPAFELLTGYTSSQIIGRDCRFLQGGDHDQPAVREIRAAISARCSAQVVLRNYRRDGTAFWNELSLSPVERPSSECDMFIGIQQDVTHREELAHELETANRRLRQINFALQEDNKIDALTNIYNRRALDQNVRMLWHTAKRVGEHFAVIFLDIDDFKQVNDDYGHDVGDACLRHVADVLESRFRRDSDVVMRYGGEEFLIASFGADPVKAGQLAQSVVNAVAANPANLLEEHGLNVQLQASAGVASQRPRHEDALEELIKRADEAMFAAKQAGKNRVRMAPATAGDSCRYVSC